jgi:hypothetical protein
MHAATKGKGYLPHSPPSAHSVANMNHRITLRTYALFGMLMLYMTYIICTIEYTLKWNNVTGVNNLGSVGQFFPFIISILNLLRVFGSIYSETKNKMRGEKDMDGDVERNSGNGSMELVRTAHAAPELRFSKDAGGSKEVEIEGPGRAETRQRRSENSTVDGRDGNEIMTVEEERRRSWYK